MMAEAWAEAKARLETQSVWHPLPGPQTDAYTSEADELFYGGAAGGGKSDLLLGLSITMHHRSIIYRREYPQLKDLIARSHEMLDSTGAVRNRQQNTWRDIPGDRTLEFGAVQFERNVKKYQGRPHDFIGFDELPNFTRTQYLFLSGWARTTRPNQRVRRVGAGNPPTDTDGEWIIERWGAWLDGQHPHPAAPGELRWYAMVDGQEVERENADPFDWKGETIRPQSRTFVPARLSDNPYLMATEYGAQLQSLPEPLRSQLLYGDFNVGTVDDAYQVIPTAWVREAQRRWREGRRPDNPQTSLGVDVARGGNDRTAIAPLHGWWFDDVSVFPGQSTPDGQIVVAQILQVRRDDSRIAIDEIGIGASPYDLLRQQNIGPVRGINNGAGSNRTDKSGRMRFVNLRAESYWMLREALDPEHGEGLALPDDRELLADLCAPRFKIRPRGIQIEEKDDIKKRIGRSPDKGDAVVMAYYAAQFSSPLGFA